MFMLIEIVGEREKERDWIKIIYREQRELVNPNGNKPVERHIVEDERTVCCC